ncbi:MAG: nucleoside-diphosphate kinase [Patescibacteria group bacterium]
MIKQFKEERTLVLAKPDGVKRGLAGEIISRIERRGLKIVAIKMVLASKAQILKHLPTDPEWVLRLGDKGLKTFNDYNLDPVTYLGTKDRKEIGENVKQGLIEYLMSGPVIAMVIEGIHAITMVRKLAGHTLPVMAEMGTIRGDFSVDSPTVANVEGRSIHNIMHASETPEEAKNEISVWFDPKEIHSYKRAAEDIMF